MNIAIETAQIWHLLSDKLSGWILETIKILPNLIVALVVVALSIAIAHLISRLVERLVLHASDSQTVTRLAVSLIRFFTILMGVFAALGILNLDKTVSSLLAGAGVIGLALGFAFQEIAANFFAGILIAFRKPYQEGDIVQIDSFVGTVNQITLRTTNLSTFSGLEVLIPNKDMFTKPVTNFTSTPERRVEINAGVSYTDDLRKVESVALAVANAIEERLPDRPAEFFFTGFGESAINFQLRFWVKYPGPGQQAFVKATHDTIINLKDAFDENGFSFPYPTRTLEIKGKDLLLPQEDRSSLPAPRTTRD